MNGTDLLDAVFTDRHGRVRHFDDAVGAGTVRDEHGRDWWFHCTAITDGTRTIDDGTPVQFQVAPAPTGLEAVGLIPLPRAG